MSSYTKKDFEFVLQNIDDLEKQAEEKKLKVIPPTIDEIDKLDKLILKFVKEHKRKIYGGTAQNESVKKKNKKDAFYDENSISDIDIYSYDPIIDLMKLTNQIYEAGFTNIHASEASHLDTYVIFVNYRKALDLSYVNKYIYDSIPTVVINELHYVHPHISLIDLYKMVSDPYFSNFRWKKAINRIYLLEKNYPYVKMEIQLPKVSFIISEDIGNNTGNKISLGTYSNKIEQVRKTVNSVVFDFLKNKTSCVLFGECAYNLYADKTKKYPLIKTPFIRIISSNYFEDCNKIIDLLLESNVPELSIKEYYPFWTLMGYTTYITYNNYPLLSISSYGGVCISNKIYDNIQYAAFDRNLSLLLTLKFYFKVNRQQKIIDYFDTILYHIINMKNDYLTKTKQNILEDTVFQKFVINCIGEVIDPLVENIIRKQKKYLAGKLVKFNYTPETDGVKEPKSIYKFANTSGNAIVGNIKNMKVAPFVYDKLPLLQKEIIKNKSINKDELAKTFEFVVEKLKSNNVEYEY